MSEYLSPREIITGSGIDFHKHCQLEFGSYVQTHEDHDNTMATRTIGAIALRPTGNSQGGYYFLACLQVVLSIGTTGLSCQCHPT